MVVNNDATSLALDLDCYLESEENMILILEDLIIYSAIINNF